MGPPTEPPSRFWSYRGLLRMPWLAKAASTAFRLRFWKYSYSEPWIWLVPLLTIVLNWPPLECPHSAPTWLWSRVNSAVASVGTYTSGPVMVLLLLSTPSIMKLLFIGRWPPTDGPVPCPRPPLLATPALSSDKFRAP